MVIDVFGSRGAVMFVCRGVEPTRVQWCALYIVRACMRASSVCVCVRARARVCVCTCVRAFASCVRACVRA